MKDYTGIAPEAKVTDFLILPDSDVIELPEGSFYDKSVIIKYQDGTVISDFIFKELDKEATIRSGLSAHKIIKLSTAVEESLLVTYQFVDSDKLIAHETIMDPFNQQVDGGVEYKNIKIGTQRRDAVVNASTDFINILNSSYKITKIERDFFKDRT